MDYKTQVELFKSKKHRDSSSLPFSVEEWEERARELLPEQNYDYIAAGAGSGDTMNANLEAFKRWRIQPRMFCDVSRRDISVSLFGQTFASPILIPPVGAQTIAHPQGDLASAKAAASLGVPYICSTASAYSLEEIAGVMGDAARWFQLYWSKDPELSASLLKRAEAAGYSAIVITLDTAMIGWRERDLRHGWLPFLEGIGIANYTSDPVFRSKCPCPPEEDLEAAGTVFREVFGNPSLTWKDLAFVREHTRLPILLKGILDPRDAELALHYGVDGLIVSNHGGRQVNGAIAALDALPRVAEVAAGKVPVLMDSGIRRGDDVLKALALGASAVLIGRQFLYGLAVAGEEGVRTVLRNLISDFEVTMALSGVCSAAEIDRSILFRV
ncbi:alpha-hydroxy-acid oxidizing protein [Brevibacillus sp. B_LB10_24]|uniref:alpha-hydroxy-acid oxidizing protein n=1 Tax=Brevibacillus sp. B_LB10_24 TaxID=3380645 RepID=UPI0038BA7B35